MTLISEAANSIASGINNSRSMAHGVHNFFPSAAHRKTNSSDTHNDNTFASHTLSKMYGGTVASR
jgi:hypothetical protein